MGACNSKKPGVPDMLAPTLMETGAVNGKDQPKPTTVEHQSAEDRVATNAAPSEIAEVGAADQNAGIDQRHNAVEAQLEKLEAAPSSLAPASPTLVAPANSPLSPGQAPSLRDGGVEPSDSAVTPARATNEDAPPQIVSSPVSHGASEQSPRQMPSHRGVERSDTAEIPPSATDEGASPQVAPVSRVMAEGSPVLRTETPPSRGASSTALLADSPAASSPVNGPPRTVEPTEENSGSKTAEALVVVPTRRSKASCC